MSETIDQNVVRDLHANSQREAQLLLAEVTQLKEQVGAAWEALPDTVPASSSDTLADAIAWLRKDRAESWERGFNMGRYDAVRALMDVADHTDGLEHLPVVIASLRAAWGL